MFFNAELGFLINKPIKLIAVHKKQALPEEPNDSVKNKNMIYFCIKYI